MSLPAISFLAIIILAMIIQVKMNMVHLESWLIRGGGGNVARDKEAALPWFELVWGENISSWG